MSKKYQVLIAVFAAAATLVSVLCGNGEGYNRYAHMELFKKSVEYLHDGGLTEIYEFYTGKNPDSVDIRYLADEEDELMWVDVHSTTEPDEDAAHFLINRSYPYCWNDSLEKLEDPEDIESCKDCVRAVVAQYPSLALPRAGQETVYFPSRDTIRSRYDFCWELPLSFVVGLVDSFCDSLGNRFGVHAENSLRAKVQVHNAKFKSMEYLNYAIRAWNDGDYESSLRWLTRICNYDPHHSLAPFKSYDYLTEDWVSQDMDGDLDIDYDDSEMWSRQLLNYGIYYLLFCDLADTRIPSVNPESISVNFGNIMDWHSFMMDGRASYSATLWELVDDFFDYINGNARRAADTLLPRIVKSTGGLFVDFYHNVVDTTHPEFLVVCIEGIPKETKTLLYYRQDYGGYIRKGSDTLQGEHFRYYEIPVSFRIEAEHCVDCDTTLGYRFDHMVVCEGDTSRVFYEPTLTVDRATTVHLVYTPYWNPIDEVETDTEQAGQQLSSTGARVPKTFSLWQNYPNPVTGSATVQYALPKDCHVTLTVYSTAGQKAMTVLDEDQMAGFRSVRLDTRSLKPGVYFYHLQAAGFQMTRKMVVLR